MVKTNDNTVERNKSKKSSDGILKLAIGIVELISVSVVLIRTIMESGYFGGPQSAEDATASAVSFVNEETLVQYTGIEYVQCLITTEPCLPGYQVKPYPYLAVKFSGNWTYIPILQTYTQEQYVADTEGMCILLRENNMLQLEQVVSEISPEAECEAGCLIAIQYVSSNNEIVKTVFPLRNGRLVNEHTEEEQKKIISIIEAANDENSIKIEMISWPNNRDVIVDLVINNFA